MVKDRQEIYSKFIAGIESFDDKPFTIPELQERTVNNGKKLSYLTIKKILIEWLSISEYTNTQFITRKKIERKGWEWHIIRKNNEENIIPQNLPTLQNTTA